MLEVELVLFRQISKNLMQAHKVRTAELMRRERGEYEGGTELMSPAPGGALR